MHALELITVCGIIVAGFACQWLAWRLKLPAILFLLLAGIFAGPLLGWLDPDALLGDLLTPIVSIAVAIILFEGSLTLKLSEIRGHGSIVRNLVTVGVGITWVGSGLAAYFLLGWDPYMAALFGAIVSVSGPTVIMPLLRTVRPSARVSSVLRWESILIDPIGAVLALLVFDVIVASQTGGGFLNVAMTFGAIIAIGTVTGIIGGYVFGQLLRRRMVPDLLRDYSALAAVLAVFSAAEALHGESGLLAVTLMGVWLANMRHVELEDVIEFKESVTLLLIASLFIVLAAKLDVGNVVALGWKAALVLAILQLGVGPLRAIVSSLGGSLSWREIAFVGWVFPRGIVAAAISSLFAIRLVDIGYPNADVLVALVFSIIIGTVIVQSLTARLVANGLRVAAPEATGVLIVGANSVALTIGKALMDAGKQVLLADSHWASIHKARMMGLPVFYGSPVSNYAEENLDLSGIGTLLAASRRPGLNELACVHYAGEFGRDHVFVIRNQAEAGHEKHMVSGASIGRVLFDGEHTIAGLAKRLKKGGVVKTTELSEEFDFDAYRRKYPTSLPIFATSKSGRLVFPVHDEGLSPTEGWQVTAIVDPEGQA